MAVLGPRALIDALNSTPTGIDGSEVFRWSLRDGMNGPQVIARAAAIVGEINQRMYNKYAGLFFETQELYARYRNGAGSKTRTPLRSEFVKPDPIRGQEVGHMLHLKDYYDGTAWTPLYLRDAYLSQIDADLREIGDRWETRFGEDIWTRALTDNENLLPGSTTGYDVGWAIGTGTNVDYIPPQYGATVHTSSHTHYVWLDDDSNDWGDIADDMIVHLRHHGVDGRLVMFISYTDISEWAAVSDQFVELTPQNVMVVAGNTSAPIRISQGEHEGIPGELVGYFKTLWGYMELRADNFIPTNYCFLTKTYGMNNPRNALAIRTHPNSGFGLRVDPQVTSSINPELDYIAFPATHGVNVNDRIMGVAGYLASGAAAWVDATVAS